MIKKYLYMFPMFIYVVCLFVYVQNATEFFANQHVVNQKNCINEFNEDKLYSIHNHLDLKNIIVYVMSES